MGVKPLLDENGVIAKAHEILPDELKSDFIKALSELEDNECHKTFTFPHTELHKFQGIKNLSIYRGYINKVSGWRLHVQYGGENRLVLCDILAGKEHDQGLDKIKSRSYKYKKKRK